MITTIFQATVDFAGAAQGELPGATGEAPEVAFGTFIGGIMSGVMMIAALLVLLYFIWGAINWISSGGDSSKTEKARNMMTQAAIGLIVLATSTAVFMLLQQFLGISVLDFGEGRSGTTLNTRTVQDGGRQIP